MIVVAGEALIDLVPDGDERLHVYCGGGPFNTARWLARLGQPTGFLGSLSDDALGERLRGALGEDGVSLELVQTTGLPTTLALASIDESGSAGYSFYTESTAAFALTTEQALAALPDRLAALHVGSLALVLAPIADAVAAVVRRAAERGALVSLDPNIRASLIADRDRYLERFQEVAGQADVIKLSVEDLEWLYPGAQPGAAAHELLGLGASVVLVTAGAEGSVIVTAGAQVALPAAPADVVDTIGAGDAFTAGFLAHWLHRNLGREQLVDIDQVVPAVRFAGVVAARACGHAGASPADVPAVS